MNKRNFLSGREKELASLADRYEAEQADGRITYWDADDLADLADWYATHKEYERAEEAVHQGLKMHPLDNALLIEQAYIYLDTRRIKQARAVADLVSDSYSSSAQILHANVLMHEGKHQEATQLLESVNDKNDLNNIVDVAYTYIDMGRMDLAHNWLENGKKAYGNQEAYIAVCADYAYNNGDIEQAAELYNQLIDMQPYCSSYWCGLAYCHYDMQQPNKVIDDCDYALIADDEYGEAYLLKGQAFFLLGNEEEGLANYRLAVRYRALSEGFLQSAIGLSEMRRGNWSQALAHLQQAIDSRCTDIDDFSSLYINAALCLIRVKEIDKALEYTRKAVKTNPENIDVLLLSGQIYMEIGQPEEAMHLWDSALRIAPYADTWNDIGEICMELGKLEQARKAFEQTRKLRPDYEGIYEKLTSVCLLLGDVDGAAKYNPQCRYPLPPEEMDQITMLFKTGADNDIIIRKLQQAFNHGIPDD